MQLTFSTLQIAIARIAHLFLQLANHDQHENLFLKLRKNLIEIPSNIYNPIVPAPGQHPKEKLFLISSDACFASYANTNAKRHCNAEIWQQPPIPTNRNGHWTQVDTFNSLDQWLQVMTFPLFTLRLTRNVMKGEEIFANYALPLGVQKLKYTPSVQPTLATISENPNVLHGSIALEGDEQWSTMSATQSPTDDSGYSGEEYSNSYQNSLNNSPQYGPSAPPGEHPEIPATLEALPSTFIKLLSLCYVVISIFDV
jgi:hypothetical protein